MANATSRTVSGISDTQVKSLFVALGEIVGEPPRFSVTGLSASTSHDDEDFNALLKENVGIIKSAHINGQGFTLGFAARSFTNTDGNSSPHPFFSTITVTIPERYGNTGSPPPDEKKALECNLEIGRFIKKHRLGAGALSDHKSTVLEPHLALISQIEASSTEQIAKLNQYFTELTDRFDARNSALTEQTDQRRSELEAEYDHKQQQLDQSREQFEKARKELDDRSNTHARRAIRGDLIRVLQERQLSFSISSDTKKLRAPIHIIFITLLLFTLTGAVWSIALWNSNPSVNFDAIALVSVIKTAVFSFSFLTTAGLYISWMNRWFDKHSEAQFQTKQFEIDINRASWAVEAALEWKGAQNEQMPDVLLSGITKHLFEVSASENTEYSPLEALASSILGSASNLKLGVGGNTMDFDRKSINEIKKKG